MNNPILVLYKSSLAARKHINRVAKVSSWTNKTLYHRLVRKVFWNYVYYELDATSRSQAQQGLMGGEESLKWAMHHADFKELSTQRTDSNFPPKRGTCVHGEIDFLDAYPIFSYLPKILRDQMSGMCIQLGSSSGKEVAYFSTFSNNMRFFGIDAYSEATEVASKRYSSPNLEFRTGDFMSTFTVLCDSNLDPVVMFSNGSLLYMFPEQLIEFFSRVATINRPISLILSEPIIICGIGSLLEIRSIRTSKPKADYKGLSMPAGNMGYSHDYTGYALMSGLRLEHIQYSFPHKRSDTVNALFHFTNHSGN
jgi:hypothetical protein